jgi:hypothetical protein
MAKRILLCTLCLSLMAGFVWWRLYAITHGDPPAQAAMVFDSSKSDAVGCPQAGAIAVRLTSMPHFSRKSRLALILLGDQSNGYAGRLAGVFDIHVSTRVIEGKGAQLRQQGQLAESVQRACEAAPKAERSPILSAVRSAFDHLRSAGCGTDTHCAFFLVTDGEENVNPDLRAALTGSKAALKRITGGVNNNGISVSICGLAQTRSASLERRATSFTREDRLKTIWTAIFTTPDIVNTAPYCTN